MVDCSDDLSHFVYIYILNIVVYIYMYILSLQWQVSSRMAETDMTAAHWQSDKPLGNLT